MDVELETLLQTAVNDRMVADVPLGAFLSGGVDSSLVVGLMQAHSTRPVRTFTIGFDTPEFDEASAAALVARHLGTDHTPLRLRPAQVWDMLPDLPDVWDEPFADESQIPTLLVSQLGRQHVTVALSGDGGDEVFGGYTRHVQAARYDPLFRLPACLRKFGARTLGLLHPDLVRQLRGNTGNAAFTERPGVGRIFSKLAKALNAESEESALRRTAASRCRQVSGAVRSGHDGDNDAGAAGAGRAYHVSGYGPVSSGRHPGQARSGQHGGQP